MKRRFPTAIILMLIQRATVFAFEFAAHPLVRGSKTLEPGMLSASQMSLNPLRCIINNQQQSANFTNFHSSLAGIVNFQRFQLCRQCRHFSVEFLRFVYKSFFGSLFTHFEELLDLHFDHHHFLCSFIAAQLHLLLFFFVGMRFHATLRFAQFPVEITQQSPDPPKEIASILEFLLFSFRELSILRQEFVVVEAGTRPKICAGV